jgi:hypothetical protein
MRAILAVTPAIALALTMVAKADPNQYLCVVEQAAGLHYEKQTDAWGPQGFPPGRKYVLRRLTEDDLKGKYQDLLADMKQAESNWGFFRESASDHLPVAACVEENIVIDNTNIPFFNCHPIKSSAMEFDKVSRRFMVAYNTGYISQGFWEQVRREYPERYRDALIRGEAHDPSRPDDLFVEIGKCSPS